MKLSTPAWPMKRGHWQFGLGLMDSPTCGAKSGYVIVSQIALKSRAKGEIRELFKYWEVHSLCRWRCEGLAVGSAGRRVEFGERVKQKNAPHAPPPYTPPVSMYDVGMPWGMSVFSAQRLVTFSVRSSGTQADTQTDC